MEDTENIRTHIQTEYNRDTGHYDHRENVPFSMGFMSPYAAMYADSKELTQLLDERLGEDRYTVWTNPSSEYQHVFQRDDVEDFTGNCEADFMNGYSLSQFLQARKIGGIHINPILFGLFKDVEKWMQFLSQFDKETLFYIDIPYETYLKVTASTQPIPQESYKQVNETIQQYIKMLFDKNAKGMH